MIRKKNRQNIIVVIIAVVIIVLAYIIINIINFFKHPANTVLIRNGEVIKYEEVIGYIIRDEEIMDTSNYYGNINTYVDDASRVCKGEKILSYVSKDENNIQQKINELDSKIQKTMEDKENIFSSDTKSLENEIEHYLYSYIKECKDTNSIKEYKSLINEKIEEKAKIAGDLSPVGSQLKNLINERMEYEKKLNDSEKVITSNKAGLVSYRVDNYENVLTINSISKLSTDELNKIKIATNQVIPIDENNIKIVNNYECYIAIPMKSEESKNAKLNDSIYLRFNNIAETLIPATVEYISEEDDDSRVIVVKITRNVEELTKYRKLEFDVVWWSYKGLKVSKDAIKQIEVINGSGEEIELNTVSIKKSSYIQTAYVKIIRETDDFAIIDNYSDSELLSLGLESDFISNRSSLKMYDELLLE